MYQCNKDRYESNKECIKKHNNSARQRVKHTFARVATTCLVLLVFGCGSDNLDELPELAEANDLTATKFNDTQSATRQLTVYLQLDSESGFQPTYADRIVVAQPVVPVITTNAEGRLLVQGIPTVIVGSSCESIAQRYPEIDECTMVDSMEVTYGFIESTATTDQEGFASLEVGQGDVRVSVRSWPTLEDDKCHWSGSSVAKSTVTSMALPLLVFCE